MRDSHKINNATENGNNKFSNFLTFLYIHKYSINLYKIILLKNKIL